MHFLLQAPIVFEVANERAVTPEITYPQVILSAVAVAATATAATTQTSGRTESRFMWRS